LKPLGINHVHRSTHAPPAAASVNQGVYISSADYLFERLQPLLVLSHEREHKEDDEYGSSM
jgi:hypothetical protein